MALILDFVSFAKLCEEFLGGWLVYSLGTLSEDGKG
jgi:hypothetical protein